MWSARLLPLLVTAFVVVPRPVPAEVKQAAPDGFLLVHELTVAAAPRVVYDAIGEVSTWWNGSHTWFGSAAGLSLDARAGGCFCERGEAGEVEHGRVIVARPGVMLRLQALLGPLQETGASGVLTFALAPVEEGTRVTVSYRVSGDSAHGFDQFAPAVDRVIGEQVARLGRRLETGRID